MSLTVEQAQSQVNNELQQSSSSFAGKLFDKLIGVANSNSDKLQSMLNDLLKQKGVLSTADEKVLSDMLEKSRQERERVRKIRSRNTIILVGVAAAIGTAIYFIVRKNKTS